MQSHLLAMGVPLYLHDYIVTLLLLLLPLDGERALPSSPASIRVVFDFAGRYFVGKQTRGGRGFSGFLKG